VGQQRFRPAVVGHAVGVDEGHQRAADQGQTGVAGGGGAEVGGQGDHPRAGVLGDGAGPGGVGGGVVHHHAAQAVQRREQPLQLGRAIAHRYHHCDRVDPEHRGPGPGEEDTGGDQPSGQPLRTLPLAHHRSGLPPADQGTGPG
jgi:hypothetical protein